MESTADYAWAFAVIGGPMLLALAIVGGIVRGSRPPATARALDASRSYPQPSEGKRGEASRS